MTFFTDVILQLCNTTLQRPKERVVKHNFSYSSQESFIVCMMQECDEYVEKHSIQAILHVLYWQTVHASSNLTQLTLLVTSSEESMSRPSVAHTE